jgi:hypothetical protein
MVRLKFLGDCHGCHVPEIVQCNALHISLPVSVYLSPNAKIISGGLRMLFNNSLKNY